MKPTIGRIVHYTARDGETVRPAIIVHVWSTGLVQLQVFTDGGNDLDVEEFGGEGANVAWVTSVDLVATPTAGCCHWPPRS